jgi:hypothetical protein
MLARVPNMQTPLLMLATAVCWRPISLQDVYLRHNPYVLNPDSDHFRLRLNPRVQPLSTRVSYSSVTPPPPALAQMARQGMHFHNSSASAFARK